MHWGFKMWDSVEAMVKAGHPQEACPHPSVCNLCWCFDLMSHWIFRQKLPGMAFLYFPHVLCFISTLHVISSPQLCSAPSLCIHPLLLTFMLSAFFSSCIFSLDLFDSSLFFPLTFTQSSNPHYSFGFFPLPTFHPLFSVAPYLAQPQPRYCECSKFPLCLPASVPLLLPRGSISILGLILQKLLFVGNWVIEDGQITLTMEVQYLKYGKLKCVLLNGACSS